MGIIAAALDAMLAAGMSRDDIVRAVAAMEEQQPRSSGAERTRRWREKKASQASQASQNVTSVTERHGDAEPRAPVHSLEEVIPPSPPKGGSSPTKKPSRKTPVDPDWQPSEKNREDARRLGLVGTDFEREWPKFLDRQKATGATYADWDAAWRSWCRKVPEFSMQKGSVNGRHVKRTFTNTCLDAIRETGDDSGGYGRFDHDLRLLSGGRG